VRTLIVIPARLGSWRFPDKPLTMIEGIPMIEHVYKRSLLARNVDEVVMAVCEDKVASACKSFGAKFVMTDPKTPTAMDRVAEAARLMGYINDDDIVVNVQGDEPAIPPPVIEFTVQLLINSDSVFLCANPVEVVSDPADLTNHHRIKAVISQNNRLIYLTRQSVPASVFDIKKRSVFYRQTCVMAFRAPFLQTFSKMKQTPLELIEGVDMLRLIENDLPIASALSPYLTQPVDTPQDIAKVVEILRSDKWFQNNYQKQK